MKQNKLPMNLQFFADPAPAPEPKPGNPQPPAEPTPAPATPQIDYAKIQQMLDGTLAAKEDVALKS